MTDLITPEELEALFGPDIPIEAATLLHESNGRTIVEVRCDLARMARAAAMKVQSSTGFDQMPMNHVLLCLNACVRRVAVLTGTRLEN